MKSRCRESRWSSERCVPFSVVIVPSVLSNIVHQHALGDLEVDQRRLYVSPIDGAGDGPTRWGCPSRGRRGSTTFQMSCWTL